MALHINKVEHDEDGDIGKKHEKTQAGKNIDEKEKHAHE